MAMYAEQLPLQRMRVFFSALKRNAFARNLGSLGSAQLAIRLSRLVTTILLSRILLPEQFGLAAVVLTIYELVGIFTRNGISAKVVQVSSEDLPVVAMTAYRMTWVISAALVAIQIMVAWPIAWFYNDLSIAWPTAAMSVIYFAAPFCNIQAAMQQREGRLGRFALANAVQVITDNFLTVIFAISGFGMWAIILPKILVAPIWIIFIRSGHAWRPRANVSPSLFHGWRDIASFGRRVLGVELLTALQANIDNILVGYFLGMHALGLYYFAFNGGLGITLGLINAAGVAVYPHLCEVRHDHLALKQRASKTMWTLGLIIVPAILMQAMLSPIYVPLVFGAQWEEAVPTLALICLSALVRPFANVISQLLKSIGQTGFELQWQFASTLVLCIGLLAACQFNITAVAGAVFVVQTIMLAGFSRFAWKRTFPNILPTNILGAK